MPLEWEDLDHDYGKWLSMGVAPDGSPVMAYYDVTMGAVGFATGDLQPGGAVRWKHEEVDGYADATGLDAGDIGQFASLAVAADGTVWVAYQAKGTLKVAHRTGGAWTPELADAGEGLNPVVGEWASIALDAEGHPVVAHHDAKDGALRVTRHDGTAWSSEEVATGQPYDGVDADGAAVHRDADVGQYASLLIADGTEYIAYHDAAQQDLRLAEGFPGAYSVSTVQHVDGGNVGHWPSLWTDGTTLRIAHEDRAGGNLNVSSRDGAGPFSVEVAVDGEFAGSDTELFARNGAAAVLYFDGRTNDMKLATEADDGWAVETLGGEAAAVGFFNEAVTTGGKQYTASYDYTNRTLFWHPLDG